MRMRKYLMNCYFKNQHARIQLPHTKHTLIYLFYGKFALRKHNHRQMMNINFYFRNKLNVKLYKAFLQVQRSKKRKKYHTYPFFTESVFFYHRYIYFPLSISNFHIN